MSAVFISHSRKDNEFAADLGRWLRERNLDSLFLDFDPAEGIPPGRDWERELYEQLQSCQALIAICSHHSMQSQWCFHEIASARARGIDIFPVRVDDCEPQAILRDIQIADFTGDRHAAYASLWEGMKRSGLDPEELFRWDLEAPENRKRGPYPGLAVFERADAALYFGRGSEIQLVRAALNQLSMARRPRLLLVLGASGSGKSSLVRAGIMPRLENNPGQWLVLDPLRPGGNPFYQLARVVAQGLSRHETDTPDGRLLDRLHDRFRDPERDRRPGESLVEVAEQLRKARATPDAQVLLVVDQAEELLGHDPGDASERFLHFLRGALDRPHSPVIALATLRSDYLAEFQNRDALRGMPFADVVIGPMDEAQIRLAIAEPARLHRLRLEPGLVDAVVADSAGNPDALPLIAYTMRELYERFGDDSLLTVREYRHEKEGVGGLAGAIRKRAEDVYRRARLDPVLERRLRAAFMMMARPRIGGPPARRAASWHDMDESVRGVLGDFVQARLLVVRETTESGSTDRDEPPEAAEVSVEVAHEALFRAWPRLRTWLAEEEETLLLRDRIEEDARQWDAAGRRRRDLLLRDHRLLRALQLASAGRLGLPAGAALDYLRRCSATHTLRKWSLRAGSLTALCVALALALVFFNQRNQALTSQSQTLSALSRQQTEKGFATLGMLLALEGLPVRDAVARPFVLSTEAALLYAILNQREQRILRDAEDGINTVRFSSNGMRIVTASRDGMVRIADIATGRTITLEGHTGQAYRAELSPDESRVVSASSDGTARIWNSGTGRELFVLSDHEGHVYDAGFSPDGTRIVTASSDHTARIWNADSGEVTFALRGHGDEVYRALFSPDGAQVLTTSADGTARLWWVDTGRSAVSLSGHGAWVVQADFSPDGERIVTASWDRTARLWERASGRLVAALEGHEDGVNTAIFAPDGRSIATTSADGTARLWDGHTGTPTAVLRGHSGLVYDAHFSTDGRRLATAADDGTTRLWEVESATATEVLRGHRGRVWSARLSPDGSRLASASEDNTVRIWHVAPEITLTGHRKPVYRALFSPDGTTLATVSDDGSGRIWDARTGGQLAVLNAGDAATWYGAYSRDGRRLVTASADGVARVWDVASGRLVHALTGHEGPVRHAHWSPDAGRVVTGGADGTARIWDMTTGAPIRMLAGHEGGVNFAEFSNDGRRILTASQDGSARLWEAPTGALLSVLSGHRGPVVNAAFSPDDRWIVTASWDRTARTWDATTGAAASTLEGHTDAVLSARFSPDSQLLVTGSSDNTARLWGAANDFPSLALKGHAGEVVDATFSADGRLVITASRDGTARLWHAASGLLVKTLRGHRGEVSSAMPAPDGRQVATASWDGTAKVWALPVAAGTDWVRFARDRLPRSLTPEERQRYLGR